MRILIFNWRDCKNPRSGGAETLTHEVAKRIVTKGHVVYLIASSFPGCAAEEKVDGVTILRRGKEDMRWLFFSVHFQAAILYFFRFRNSVDIVVDEIHGLPFFTPLYVKQRVVALICEVAGDLWIPMFGRFFGKIGQFCERFYLTNIYRQIDFLTISESTRKDLIKENVNRKQISVLPMGLTIPTLIKRSKKEKQLTLVFVGRLTESKGVEAAINAVSILKAMFPSIQLWIVGRGDKVYKEKLWKLVEKSNLHNNVRFLGYVSDDKKFNYMSKAHVILVPSLQEGWGLIVPEAARVGTPAVVYKTKGLRDIVKHNVTGMVCNENSPQDLANNVIQLISDRRKYISICNNALLQSKQFDWDNTANTFISALHTL